MSAIRELREAVEAGTWGAETKALRSWPSSFRDLAPWEGLDRRTRFAWGAYHGSVDAALALMEAVLPGWDWLINSRANYATVWEPEGMGDRHEEASSVVSPARALLIAILKAMETQP